MMHGLKTGASGSAYVRRVPLLGLCFAQQPVAVSSGVQCRNIAACCAAAQPAVRKICPLTLRSQRQPMRVIASASAQAEDAANGTIEMDIKVSGMMCGGCTERVTKALQEAEGVTSVDAVNLDTGIATVQVAAPDQFEAATNALPHLVSVIEALGFEAEPYFE